MCRLATAALELLTLSAGPAALAALAGDFRPASKLLAQQAAAAAVQRREMQVGLAPGTCHLVSHKALRHQAVPSDRCLLEVTCTHRHYKP
jgi:hypothetical protein